MRPGQLARYMHCASDTLPGWVLAFDPAVFLQALPLPWRTLPASEGGESLIPSSLLESDSSGIHGVFLGGTDCSSTVIGLVGSLNLSGSWGSSPGRVYCTGPVTCALGFLDEGW